MADGHILFPTVNFFTTPSHPYGRSLDTDLTVKLDEVPTDLTLSAYQNEYFYEEPATDYSEGTRITLRDPVSLTLSPETSPMYSDPYHYWTYKGRGNADEEWWDGESWHDVDDPEEEEGEYLCALSLVYAFYFSHTIALAELIKERGGFEDLSFLYWGIIVSKTTDNFAEMHGDVWEMPVKNQPVHKRIHPISLNPLGNYSWVVVKTSPEGHSPPWEKRWEVTATIS